MRFENTSDLRGAEFENVDLAGARFQNVNLEGIRAHVDLGRGFGDEAGRYAERMALPGPAEHVDPDPHVGHGR